MPQDQFEALQRQIALLSLEWREAMMGINDKVDTMTAALKSCQSHCHVANQNQDVPT